MRTISHMIWTYRFMRWAVLRLCGKKTPFPADPTSTLNNPMGGL